MLPEKLAAWGIAGPDAGRLQREGRLLVLTHFSRRYGPGDGEWLAAEAATAFGGQVVLAHDLDRIPVPRRR
jgi:ribonuclease Z